MKKAMNQSRLISILNGISIGALVLMMLLLFAYAKTILTYYVAAVVGYGAVTYVACSWKYSRAKRSLKNYYHNLKKLNSLYSETK